MAKITQNIIINSIYNREKMKEKLSKKMKEDLDGKYADDYFKNKEEYEKFYSLNDDEYCMCMILKRIVNDINEWKFCTNDTLWDMVEEDYDLSQYNNELSDFGLQEILEVAKDEYQIIDGFMEIGGDLWLIKECQ